MSLKKSLKLFLFISLGFNVIFLVFQLMKYKQVEGKSVEIDKRVRKDNIDSLAIDSIFTEHFNQLNAANVKLTQTPGAAIVIVRDSSVIHQQVMGVKNVKSKLPVDANTIFRIGSLSKGFTGILASKLHNKGIIDLDSPVTQYLPNFKLADSAQTQRIKLFHLLSHSTGLPPHSYTLDIEAGRTPTDILPMFERVELVGKEGTHFYQNAAFALIESIIEKQTGKSFRDVLKEEILAPLEMSSVKSSHKEFIDYGNYSYPHKWNRRSRNYEVAPFKKKYYSAVSAGGLSASSTDMAKWLIALLGNKPNILSANDLSNAFTPYANSHKDLRGFNNWSGVDSTFYGLGWRILQYKDRKLIYHGGYVDEFRTDILLDPSRNLGICVLFNSTSSYASRVTPNFLNYFDLLEAVKNEVKYSE